MKPILTKEKADELQEVAKILSLYSTVIMVIDTNTAIGQNGTLTLYRSDNQVIGITANHVIEQCLISNSVRLQIAGHFIDLDRCLIDHNEYLDLATLRFEDWLSEEISKQSSVGIGSGYVESIYNKEIKSSDIVSWNGFPGCWKDSSDNDKNKKSFELFSMVDSTVNTVGMNDFECRTDEVNSYYWYNNKIGKNLAGPGGISGGPVLIEMIRDGGIKSYELAGIIKEGKILFENQFVIKATHAKFIRADGTIEKIIQ